MEVIHIGPQGTPTSQQGVETDKQRALDHLKSILTSTKGHLYKIGISTNPTGRSYAHGKVAVDEREEGDLTYVTLQRGFWAQMYVIFQSPSAETVRTAEKEYIRLANAQFGNFQTHNLVTMNTSSGGGGPLGDRGPYFLYVLRSGG